MNVAAIAREFRELPLALIDEPSSASRSSMSDELMDELVASIRNVGLLEPMLVARVGARYEVIAGHRRRIACGRAGLVVAPCIVYPSKEAALEAIKYAENRHREELSPADEAIWFSELLERDAGGDVDTLAGLLGERRSYIESRLLLFSGDAEVFQALADGKITIGVAQQLNKCGNDTYRRSYLRNAINGGATVSVVAGWIAEWKAIHEPATAGVQFNGAASAPAPAPDTDYFRCVLCEKSDDVHAMQPVNMHTYCHKAIFAEMLALWKHRYDYTRTPRTLEEAVEVVNDLIERFPQLLEPDARRI